MRVLEARNVHEALPKAMWMMSREGVPRESRNGPVLVHPDPVTTVYVAPKERVLFWPQREANPAFHLYESLWMLAGRNDLAPLVRYVKTFGQFSDDGVTLYGAYGYRWRMAMDDDQLAVIARRLRENPDDRRCVLQIWMGQYDLDRDTKDLPCNLTVTFQVNVFCALDMTVFNRSNDIVLGAYGANAVHFSVLHEYMAIWIGIPVGVYRQVSCNWHAYQNEMYEKVKDLARYAEGAGYAQPSPIPNPYRTADVYPLPLVSPITAETPADTIQRFDKQVSELLMHAETGFVLPRVFAEEDPWMEVAYAVLRAHHIWRTSSVDRFKHAFASLARADQKADWIVAMRQWLERREAKA